jgi:glycosyltransferase involved in cell wall biosynthesis/2-polyprenyl-3-methyl-5-hydroxy-6-metoxy-1,4-benzoquinol methylase
MSEIENPPVAVSEQMPAGSSIPVDRIAELYNGEIFTEETAEVARRRIHWMCSQCEGESVLDIGCSQGITCLLLAREGMSVTGLDSHPEAMAYARNATKGEIAAVQDRIRWIEGDLADLDIEARFDTLLMGEVIEHQALPPRFLARALQFAKPGARIVLTTPFGLYPHPDHKVSLFPRDLASMAQHLAIDIELLDVTDGYMRLVARAPGRAGGGGLLPIAQTLLVTTEQATLASQGELYERLSVRGELLKKRTETIKSLQKQLADSLKGTKSAEATTAAKLATLERERARAADAYAEQRAEVESLRSRVKTLTLREAELEAGLADLTRREKALQSEWTIASDGFARREQELGNELALVWAAQESENQLSEQLRQQVEQLGQEVQRSERQARVSRLVAEHQSRSATRLSIGLRRFAERGRTSVLRQDAAVQATRNSVAYRVGACIAAGVRSPKALLRMPIALVGLASELRQRRREQDTSIEPKAAEQLVDRFVEHYQAGGVPAVVAALESIRLPGGESAQMCTNLSQYLRGQAPEPAAQLAREAYLRDPVPTRARWAAFRLFDAGHLQEPAALLAVLPGAGELSQAERRKATTVIAQAGWVDNPPATTIPRSAAHKPLKGTVLVVTGSPTGHPAGSSAAHALETFSALRRKRVSVTSLAAPTGGALRLAPQLQGGGQLTEDANAIRFAKLREAARNLPPDAYLDEATQLIKAAAVESGSAAICAVADADFALPALRAARALGVPFIYDMQAPAETRRIWKVADADLTERFQLGLSLEAHVAREADHVYVANAALLAHLLSNGVAPERVSILAVGVDLRNLPSSTADAPLRAPNGPLVLAYAGPIGSIDGLDLLVEAVALLAAQGIDCEARLVGDGPAREVVKQLAEERGVAAKMKLLGQKPSEYSLRRLAAADVAVFPLRSAGAFDLACPIEMIQCMGMGVPVVAADGVAMALEIVDGVTGRLFRAGDSAHLARVLTELAQQPEQARAIGLGGREYVKHEHSLDAYCRQVRADLQRLTRVPDDGEAGADTDADALPTESAHDNGESGDEMTAAFASGGCAVVVERVRRRYGRDQRGAAGELLRIGRLLRESGVEDAELPLAAAAAECRGDDATLRAWFWAAQRAKDFPTACEVILKIEALYGDSPSMRQQEMLERLHKSPAYLLTVLREARPANVDVIPKTAKRLCYVLHNTLPYSSGGYATRSHGVAGGIRDAGWDVIVLSRPGFPLDIVPELTAADVAPIDSIDGISYVRTLQPLRVGLSARTYILASADAIEAQLREHRPELVLAASNHVTALPALIAARRLGIPFVYEVRGLWEVTRMSRDTDFQDTANFHIQKVLEGSVAQMADYVFTLTEPMREELVARGVPIDHIDLLPNSCDPQRFVPMPRDAVLAARLGILEGIPVIGYIGTFVDYEGLEDLAAACALLKARGAIFRLMLVGNENASGQERGPITAQIVEIAEQTGYSDWLILPGRVAYEEVESYYSLIDIAPFPRKPWPVCEMVSPMKPLEALAMEKAVVVSSVRALVEMIRHHETGLVFDKGNVVSLADTLEQLIDDNALQQRLGQAGRDWVQRERTWTQIGLLFDRIGRELVNRNNLE